MTRQSFDASPDREDPFCECGEEKDTLHKVCTLMLGQRVRKNAQQIQDERLLRKLSVGDMIAWGVLYHSRCLSTLYNKGDRDKNNTAIDQCQKKRIREHSRRSSG